MNLAAARESITDSELGSHVFLLADDSLEGREAGSQGGYAAGNYLVNQLHKLLQPGAPGGSFFQPFNGRLRNVLGVLPGNDPMLRDEYIVIGAHYDHVGYGNRKNSRGPLGFIHNGADDNASGTACLMEVIQGLSNAKVPLRRSVLFAFWDGEEQGLLGSQYWAAVPTVAWQQIRLAINIDMIGHLDDEPLQVIGTRSMPGLRWLMAQANHQNEMQLSFPWEIKENSDHHTFFSRNVPVLMFHTGLHDDYHTPADDADTIDLKGLQATSRYILNAVVTVANADELGRFRIAARHEGTSAQQDYERPLAPLPPRLGVTWAPPSESELSPGLKLRMVTSGSAADLAGLEVGDSLLAVGGEPLLSGSTLQQAVVAADRLQLTVQRHTTDVVEELDVPLPGNGAQLGITWRTNAAEPETVCVARVVPHSRADQAGVKTGDRIHQVGGLDFSGSDEFFQLTREIEWPATLVIERQGRVFELVLGQGTGTLASPVTGLRNQAD